MNPKPTSSTSRSHLKLFRDTFDRKFITPQRAMREFLLKPQQLEGLTKHLRRSPYESELYITVYTRRDVTNRAIEVWGSFENIEKEKKKLEHLKQFPDQYNFDTKKIKRDERRSGEMNSGGGGTFKKLSNEHFVIGLAVCSDILNFTFKLVVWFLTNSESVMAETIHAAADTLNQSVLVIGLCQISQAANSRHPYGYSNTMFVVSLISGVGIFCLGAAVSVFSGVLAIVSNYHELIYKDILWAFAVLAFSCFTDSICFVSTVSALCKSARLHHLGFFYYAFRADEPAMTVILLEDFASVMGNIIAALMLTISWTTNNFIPDAVGSIIIGIILGGVALFLIVTNSAALVGRSIPAEKLEAINQLLESDVMIRAIYDVKSLDMGNSLIRYKAEIDFDGAELTRLYLENLNLEELLRELGNISKVQELEAFMVNHGEKIVDLIGREIDRIEMKVRKQFPQVRHMDLEIL